MKTERFEIKNRQGLKLVIQVDTPDYPKNLVFIEPGQSGTIDQVHITAFAEAFLENGFTAVRFDPTNSLGESGGDLINVTYDNYVEDLEDVIDWARTQDWFQQPYAVCGHSMGAQAAAWIAEQRPEEILLVAPMAPVVNYELYLPTIDPEERKQWQKKGYQEAFSKSKPGVVKKVGWGVVESLKKYDIVQNADKLTMPVINIVGDKDQPCPLKHQQVFMDAVASNNKKLVVIPGAQHSYRNSDSDEYGTEVGEVKTALSSWLHDLNRLK
jgi:alpha-beta hydrolase superfamily lysophospholipase